MTPAPSPTLPAAVPLRRGHLTLVHSTDAVPAAETPATAGDGVREVPPLLAATAGLVVLLAGSTLAVILAGLAGPAGLPVALAGIVATGLAALATVTRTAYGPRPATVTATNPEARR